jgi:preprotein translocase subunit SecA
MNTQRQKIYDERNKILDGKDITAHVSDAMADTVSRRVDEFCPSDADPEDWDLAGLRKWAAELTGRGDMPEFDDDDDVEDIEEKTLDFVQACYDEKAERLGDEIMKELSAQIMLRVIDTRWMSYLQEMDYLKTGIGLRGFGQRDPLAEYKTEAYRAFKILRDTMYEDFIRTILRIELARVPEEHAERNGLAGARFSGPAEVDGDQADSAVRRQAASARRRPRSQAGAAQASAGGKAPAAKPTTYRKDLSDPYANVGRNDPCPCGSGKKFKNCHGKRH